MYVLEKTIATFGTFFLLYQYTEHYIMPHVPDANQSFAKSLLDLALPFMVSRESLQGNGRLTVR